MLLEYHYPAACAADWLFGVELEIATAFLALPVPVAVASRNNLSPVLVLSGSMF